MYALASKFGLLNLSNMKSIYVTFCNIYLNIWIQPFKFEPHQILRLEVFDSEIVNTENDALDSKAEELDT